MRTNVETNIKIPLNGKIIVNETTMKSDKMTISRENIMFYNNKTCIGKIKRNKIKSLYEINKEYKLDLIDNLIYLFDIRKIGDL